MSVLMDITWNLTCPYYPEGKFSHSQKKKTVLLMRLENLSSCYCEVKLWQKWDSFVEVTWKFELPLLSRAEIFAKTRQFCWTDSKIWTASIMTGFKFLKNKRVFMISPENLNCSYYYELKFLQKYPIFNEAIWTFELPHYLEV